jgi:RNA-directed DNA polymerase
MQDRTRMSAKLLEKSDGSGADGWNPAGTGSSVSVGESLDSMEPKPLETVMEQAVSGDCWEAAQAAVIGNRGAAGPDGMPVTALRAHLLKHGEAIKRKLLSGSYLPAAARRVEIAKPNGGTRGLNIPNVVDRFVQQLLVQVLTPHLDPQMSTSSFGFRPGRSAHDAVRQAQAYAREGCDWVVDMDIEAFFDRVNHDVLMRRLTRDVQDRRALKLINRMLSAGHILPQGEVVRSEQGTPQGGPLSPLLSNLYLDALDRELTKRGLRFCRYADDCNIYVGSRQAGERVLAGVSAWLSKHLKLTVHPGKSGVGRAWERKFLGFTLTLSLLLTVSGASIARYQDRVREHFDARRSVTSVELRDSWERYVRGWWGYYRLCEERRPITRWEGWTRRHIRKCFWQRWHSAEGRYRNLRKLGLHPELAGVARSSRGAWRLAGGSAMQKALSNRVLRSYRFFVPTDLG